MHQAKTVPRTISESAIVNEALRPTANVSGTFCGGGRADGASEGSWKGSSAEAAAAMVIDAGEATSGACCVFKNNRHRTCGAICCVVLSSRDCPCEHVRCANRGILHGPIYHPGVLDMDVAWTFEYIMRFSITTLIVHTSVAIVSLSLTKNAAMPTDNTLDIALKRRPPCSGPSANLSSTPDPVICCGYGQTL